MVLFDSDDLERVFQQTPFLEVELVTGLPKWILTVGAPVLETCLFRLNKQVSSGIILQKEIRQ